MKPEAQWERNDRANRALGERAGYQAPKVRGPLAFYDHTLAPARSSTPDVRNPVLGLPGIDELRALPAECREPLRQVLMGIRADAQAKAQVSWRKNKGPMAAYWKAVGVYAGHIARAIR